jgi:hypothetical protein
MKTICKLTVLAVFLSTSPTWADFKAEDKNGRIEIRDDGTLVFGWQYQLLKDAVGGKKFAGSAYVHPLATPSGFKLTQIQPSDHLHHYGVWWPWKLLTVKEHPYITWEMQVRQGRHVGVSASIQSQSANEVVLEVMNQSEIKPADSGYQPVTMERATLRFARHDQDAYVLDITICDEPVAGTEVEVTKYRYSGFSWRGPEVWNKDNSRMHTSAGKDRDTANGREARWVTVDGQGKTGPTTMLIMSAASKNDGPSERLRVWDSKNHQGTPFVNFNPVMQSSIPMLQSRKEVTLRRYRLIVADRFIPPTKAEELWQAWK